MKPTAVERGATVLGLRDEPHVVHAEGIIHALQVAAHHAGSESGRSHAPLWRPTCVRL